MLLLLAGLVLMLMGGAAGPAEPAAAAPLKQCADGIDNEGDTKVDFPADPGCLSTLDNDETDPAPLTAAAPLSSQPLLAASSIDAPELLSPFPVVRLRGRIMNRTVRVSRLTVTSPRGSRITIICRGPRRSCPSRRSTRMTTGGTVRLRPFERRMRSGTILRIFVTKPGFVGKFTRFAIRSNGTPARTDACARPDLTSFSCL